MRFFDACFDCFSFVQARHKDGKLDLISLDRHRSFGRSFIHFSRHERRLLKAMAHIANEFDKA